MALAIFGHALSGCRSTTVIRCPRDNRNRARCQTSLGLEARIIYCSDGFWCEPELPACLISDLCLSGLPLELPLSITIICSYYIAVPFVACIASCGMAYDAQAQVPGWQDRSVGQKVWQL